MQDLDAERFKLLTNKQYLIQRVSTAMASLKEGAHSIRLNQLLQTDANDYESVFRGIVQQVASMAATGDLLKVMMDLVELKDCEVWSLTDLLLKWGHSGLCATEHDDCDKDEVSMSM